MTEDLLLHAVILLHGLRLPAGVLRWVFLPYTRAVQSFRYRVTGDLVVVVLQCPRPSLRPSLSRDQLLVDLVPLILRLAHGSRAIRLIVALIDLIHLVLKG